MSEILAHGPALVDRGYRVIPITKGSKACHLKGWQELHADRDMVDRWAGDSRYGGLGVPTAQLPAVDLDVLDTILAGEVHAFCRDLLGPGPVRIGLAPKLLLPCRYAGEPFTKMKSKTYRDLEGREHKVEILGKGQQFVAYAEHPDTKQPYRWPEGDLYDWRPDELPVLDHEKAQAIIDQFESLVPDSWEAISGAMVGGAGAGEDDWALAVAPVADLSETAIRAALARISPDDDYDRWLQVGMALYHQFRGSTDGFDLWEEWSTGAKTYDAYELETKWKSFSVQARGRKSVTMRSVMRLARAAEGPASLLDEALRRYVHVKLGKGGSRVADLSLAPAFSVCSLAEFRSHLANQKVMVEGVNKDGDPVEKTLKLAGVWLDHDDRRSAHDTVYMPGEKRVFAAHDLEWINTFHMPAVADLDVDIDRLAVFQEHMKYLFPVKQEHEWFLDWMAFNIQAPQRRCKVTPLHIASAQGTGRGWVCEAMERLLGEWNCSREGVEKVLSGKYKEFMHQTLFCVIDEIKNPGKRYGAMDKLNEILTEDRQNIEIKYGAKTTQKVYTNFLLLSNKVDGLAIDPQDRRVNVFIGPRVAQAPEYYDVLYSWLEDVTNVEHLRVWLGNRDLRTFNAKTAMDSASKREVIRGAMSPIEVAFLDMKESPPRGAMTTKQVMEALPDYLDDAYDAFEEIGPRQLSAILRKHCRTWGSKIKLKGLPTTIWVLEDRVWSASSIRWAVEHGEGASNGGVVDLETRR